MQKRGQVTVFIVVGIVILFLSASLFFIIKSVQKDDIQTAQVESLPPQTESIKLFVQSCLAGTAEEAIKYNFINGGFYQPTFVTLYEEWKIPYYFYLGEDVHPLQEQIEDGIADYTSKHLDECLNDFPAFKGVTVEQGDPIAFAEIKQDDVLMRLNLPLTIRQGPQVTELNFFDVRLDIALSQVISSLEQNVLAQHQNPNEVMLTPLVFDAANNNYQIETIFNDDDVIYIVQFNDVKVQNSPLQVQYAAKYNWFDELEKPIDLEPIPRQRVSVGSTLNYQLQFVGENVLLQSDNNKITFTPDNILTFTPELSDVGENFVTITAANETEEDSELILIEVVS